jgi:hypothetical protein
MLPYRRGRISCPHGSVIEAASAQSNEPQSTILVYPGNYAGAVTFNTPCTIRAPYGIVTLGQ